MKRKFLKLWNNFPFLFLFFCCVGSFIKNKRIEGIIMLPILLLWLLYITISFLAKKKALKTLLEEFEERFSSDHIV